ncbi:MAG: ABC transporter substrate-binding protein, partial [Deltaproteobacteria bacterium]|nr:ABC transporter substrate-binding protein [Candidatus Desulfobacula maris]
VGRNAYKVAGIFDEHWYDETMSGFKNTIEIEELSAEEQANWDKKFSEMLVKWAEELEAKGLMAKKALIMFKEEQDKLGVSFKSCPVF